MFFMKLKTQAITNGWPKEKAADEIHGMDSVSGSV